MIYKDPLYTISEFELTQLHNAQLKLILVVFYQ